jgi:hypothetical protein
MKFHLIKVSLGNDRYLEVMPNYCEIEIEDGQPSRLIWILDESLADFQFVAGKGHAWSTGVPQAIFGNPDYLGGKAISIRNHNLAGKSLGEYKYTLCVEDIKNPEVSYATPPDDGSDDCHHRFRGKHPVIINK